MVVLHEGFVESLVLGGVHCRDFLVKTHLYHGDNSCGCDKFDLKLFYLASDDIIV